MTSEVTLGIDIHPPGRIEGHVEDEEVGPEVAHAIPTEIPLIITQCVTFRGLQGARGLRNAISATALVCEIGVRISGGQVATSATKGLAENVTFK